MANLAPHIIPNNSTLVSPSIASNPMGTICVAWKGSGNQEINLIFNSDQGVPDWQWNDHTIIPDAFTNLAPAVTYFGERLFVAWVMSDGSNRIRYTFSDDQGKSFPDFVTLDNASSSEAPSLIGGKSLLISFTSTTGEITVMTVG